MSTFGSSCWDSQGVLLRVHFASSSHCYWLLPQVRVVAPPGKRVEHQGIKIELLGQIELFVDRGSFYDFISLGTTTFLTEWRAAAPLCQATRMIHVYDLCSCAYSRFTLNRQHTYPEAAFPIHCHQACSRI